MAEMTEVSEPQNQSDQILKSRDDQAPVRLCLIQDEADAHPQFKLHESATCSWAKKGERFGPMKLRPRIEPWLTALVQSEHLSLLIGSGLTHAIHGIATDKTLTGMDTIEFGVFDDEISAEAKRIAKIAQRENGNFEDQIRVANELLRGLEILPDKGVNGTGVNTQASNLREALKNALDSLTASILEAEHNLASSCEQKRVNAFNYLVNFLMSFASRAGTRERLNLFTTNYDRYIEVGADVAGLRMIDRFVGTLTPVFRASRLDIDLHYNPPGIRGEPRYLEGVARFTKLHGSIDWVDCDRAIRRIGLPFGAQNAKPFLTASGLGVDAQQLMIYPNAAKDRETAHYPYVELFRDLATAICRPNSTLICYGYSFGDEHINRVIEDMLMIPSTHLVIISYGDPLYRIMDTYERLGRPAQVTLLVGDHLGDLRTLVDQYLPKSAIDRTTLRMADLLKARLSATQDGSEADQEVTPNEEDVTI